MAQVPTFMTKSLLAPVAIDEKSQLVSEILQSTKPDRSACNVWCAYYAGQCAEALDEDGKLCSARSHQDIKEVTELILASKSLEVVLASLQERYKNRPVAVPEGVLKRTIELAARVLTMHEIGRWHGTAARDYRLSWSAGTLQECLKSFHATSTLVETVKLEQMFNVVTAESIAGFEIEWTDNLAEHLVLLDRGVSQTVRIFHHASFLQMSLDQTVLFPTGFVQETLNTLALLFPQRNRAVKAWLSKRITRDQQVDARMLLSGQLTASERHIDCFPYWRDRLIVLKQAYDEAEPITLKQWWFDRRRKVQWSTFWVAVLVLVLTIFFGVIQSIEGALQVYKAYNPA